jgi:hypothetical protein
VLVEEDDDEDERWAVERAVEGTVGFFSVPTVFPLLSVALGPSAWTLISLERDGVVGK